MTARGRTGPVAYGLLFTVGVPVLLVAWARAAESLVPLPAPRLPAVGWSLVGAGGLLLVGGMWALRVRGGGLPMNAFPPPRFVGTGLYHWIRDPIYAGFGAGVLGVALATGSSAGLWLVTPSVWAAMAALVAGYERHDLRHRFPDEADQPTALALPPADDAAPSMPERVAVAARVFGPWLLLYYGVQALGRPPDAVSTRLAFEGGWPVLQWMEGVYVSAYAVVPLAVLSIRTRAALRRFAKAGWTATVVVGLCWLTIPVVAEPRPFEPSGVWGRVLAWEQGHSAGVAAFPAFHVLWPLLVARAWSVGRGAGWRGAVWGWAAVVALATLATGHHGIVDVVAAVALYPVVGHPARSWAMVRGVAERIANSWREWRVGPVRFMNHGLYAAAAGATGVIIAGSAAGPDQASAVAWVAACAMLGAGAYAQVLEGSSRLLRPFGWYGGFIGGLLGILTAPWLGGRIVPLLAAFALASPFVQSVGRLRCLVQGCCHGAPTRPDLGIRYTHPRSRVCHIAEWRGIPLVPTPVFSIAGNLLLGALLLRLRALGAADLLIVGVYFIGSGVARFVEESHRGEPQTPHVKGLRLYQWFAVATVLGGVVVTMLPLAPTTGTLSAPARPVVLWALVFFVVAAMTMGLDFPGSDRRFSRLASNEPLE